MVSGILNQRFDSYDHILNFGATPVPGTFDRVTDAMVELLLHRVVEVVIKWADDFVFFCYPACQVPDGSFKFTYTADLI